MAKRRKGSKRYEPAPWSHDFNSLKRGGVAPWFRTKKGGKSGGHRAPRGGGR